MSMKVSREACQVSNPCSKFGNDVSGCMKNLKKISIGNFELAPEAAKDFEVMLSDMEKDGIKKGEVKINGAYRPLARQCEMFDWDYFESTGKKRKKGTGGVAIAFPGSSNHGWGRALDISGSKVQKWIKDNGYKYGWCWGEVKSEPWHFTYCGEGPNKSKSCNSFCKGSKQTPTIKTSDDDTIEIDSPEKKGGEEMDLISIFKTVGNLMAKDKGGIDIKEDINRLKDIMKKIL